MALETLAVERGVRTGAQLTRNSVTTVGGFRFLNDGHTLMIFTEKNAANCEVGITSTITVDGKAVDARVVDVTASQEWVLGPWPPLQYNDADGYATFTVEADQASAVGLVSVR